MLRFLTRTAVLIVAILAMVAAPHSADAGASTATLISEAGNFTVYEITGTVATAGIDTAKVDLPDWKWFATDNSGALALSTPIYISNVTEVAADSVGILLDTGSGAGGGAGANALSINTVDWTAALLSTDAEGYLNPAESDIYTANIAEWGRALRIRTRNASGSELTYVIRVMVARQEE